ncbi:hypothetical protein [Robiginitomaculum antarcticum]|uniref:hypothetical protein n=1 Tax=Robiginitomaculum antarcticum TaxID=437507 RepID=UPI00039C66A8|nr:hypothetical protein [Robiginitomaculum antarcticum]
MENKKPNRSGFFAAGGAFTGIFAFIGASCCILPIILINLGVSSALVSHLSFLARLQPWFTALTISLVLGGIIYAYRGGRKPSRRIFLLLLIGGGFAVAASILPYYEGQIQRWLSL